MNDIPHTHGARLGILERGFEELTKKIASAPMADADKNEILSHISDLRARVDGLHDQHTNLEARVYALEGVVGSTGDQPVPQEDQQGVEGDPNA